MATATRKGNSIASFLDKREKQWNEDNVKLLKSGQFSDVVFKVGDQEFQAHKAILSVHSPVFSAMFEHKDTLEAQEGKVVIIDIEPGVFGELLNYIYSGKPVIMDYYVAELFVAADKVCLFIAANFNIVIPHYCSISQIMPQCFAKSTVTVRCLAM